MLELVGVVVIFVAAAGDYVYDYGLCGLFMCRFQDGF